MLRNRRRPDYGAPACAIFSGVLLLLSVSLLYIRLNATSGNPELEQYDALSANPLLTDTTDLDYLSSEDPIDQLDDLLLDSNSNSNPDDDDEDDSDQAIPNPKGSSSMYYYDHVAGVVRRGYNMRSIEEWEDYVYFDTKMRVDLGLDIEGGTVAFDSDDFPVEERIRKSLVEVDKIEDALFLKGSVLREGWGEWFDKKTDFLRRDRMFKSNLEGLNPLNNPLLQDPDGGGVTGLTRGDKIVIKGIMNEFKRVPFLGEKSKMSGMEAKIESGMKRVERRTLGDGMDLKNEVNVGKKSKHT